MTLKEIECTIIDDVYEVEDFDILAKITYTTPNDSKLYAWDGLEWSEKGFNRVYTNRNSQHEYDDIVKRIFKLRDNGILFEIARELNEDQSYYFENERIYLYVESKKDV